MKAQASSELSRSRRSVRAFTLVEILVVMVLIAIIAAFATPAMNAMLRGSKITLAGDELIRNMNLARQTAIRDNAPIEFRFYRFSDPDQPNSEDEYRAYQAVRRYVDPDNQREFVTEAVTQIVHLPDAVIFTDETRYSSLLSEDVISSSIDDVEGEASEMIGKEFSAFQFMTDGGTNLDNDLWFITIRREVGDSSELPDDFVTVQVDPFTGKIQRYDK